ncbi:MAG UNVERIFIED_CONTAM: hypothetical protein LVR29_18510 [Microcystis novacekii LVE1205-3]
MVGTSGIKTGFSCDRGFPDHDFNFCGRGITLVPLVFTQAQQFVNRLPEWLDSVTAAN